MRSAYLLGALLLLGTGAGVLYLCGLEDEPAPAPRAAERSTPEPTPQTAASPPADVVAEAPPPVVVQAQQEPERIKAGDSDPDGPPQLPQRPGKDNSPPGPEDVPEKIAAPAGVPGKPARQRPPDAAPGKPPEWIARPPAWPAAGGVGRNGSLTPAEQLLVNAAIERGVAFLLQSQLPNGSWSEKSRDQVGYAALGGLALLESGVPPAHPAVLNAAALVRLNAVALKEPTPATYQLSLAILFLDRLGAPADRPLIQGLALRLLAGQNAAGGWGYQCPGFKTPDPQQLRDYLRQLQARFPQGPLAGRHPGAHPGLGFLGFSHRARKPGMPMAVRPALPGPLLAHPRIPPVAPKGLPAAGAPTAARPQDDNSNTQFALMALWAARRHFVPTVPTFALVEQRFRASQLPDGGWGYRLSNPRRARSMTCVGLLGLAVGRGSALEAQGPLAALAGPSPQDAAVTGGLQALGAFLSQDVGGGAGGRLNTYFLWSVERVGVTYSLKTIGGTDWYRWGVGILLPTQRPDGGWCGYGYPGSSPPLDTSMALLFLRRANLAPDLSVRLRQALVVRDPGAPFPAWWQPPGWNAAGDGARPAGGKSTELWVQSGEPGASPMRLPAAGTGDGPSVSLGEVKAGTQSLRRITLRGSVPFRIVHIKGTDAQLNVQPGSESKTEHELTIELLPDGPGELSRTLRILTDLPDRAEVEISLKAKGVR